MPDPQLLRLHRGPTGSRRHQRVEAAIEIEITIGSIGGRRVDPPDTATVGRAGPGEVEHEPARESSREGGEYGIGCRGHLRQQRNRVFAVLLDQFGQRGLIDPADLGRDVVERLVAPELFPRSCPPRLVGEGLAGVFAFERQWRTGSAP